MNPAAQRAARGRRALACLAVVLLAAACSVSPEIADDADRDVANSDTLAEPTSTLPIPTPTPLSWPVTVEASRESRLDTSVYEGLGAWLDVFDYSPTYGKDGVPATGPEVVDEMAAAGVKTLYLQTVRRDDDAAPLTEDPALLAAFISRAHTHDIAVVGWYLPTWSGPEEADLDRLLAVLAFDFDGHRFDGLAVDIEGVPEPAERADWNRRLVALSTALREAAGDRSLGAIVLPPVLIEEVNDAYWPEFPWAEIGPLYDAWLPMAYWSFRKPTSVWADPAAYAGESIDRLRANVADPDAVVHAVGGVGLSDSDTSAAEPIAAISDLAAFVQAAHETGSVGWSIYDWMTISSAGRDRMVELNQARN